MSKKDEALKALEALESDWDGCVNSPKGEALAAIRKALAEQPASKPPTDEQITAGARALCKQMAEACGVDVADQWQLYAETFKEDARAVLEAANGIKEKT